MTKTPFKRGDIVELGDGSIYILEEYLSSGTYDNGPSWRITTILETHQGVHHRGNHFPDIPEDWLDDAKVLGSMETLDGPPCQTPPSESDVSPASDTQTSSD